ncbi:MAG: hypothetical protein ABIR35_03375 [Polaromonas sp.]
MRHLFLIILIALLPLRGWVNDAMATGMVTAQVQQQAAEKIVAPHAHEAGAKARHGTETLVADASQTAGDCSGHAYSGRAHADDKHCDSCSVCQACHTVALPLAGAHVSASFNLRSVPRAGESQFASAEAALGQKPPIS